MTWARIIAVAWLASAAWGPYLWARLRVGYARRHWLTVLGTVVESRLEEFGSAWRWQQWRPLIRYRYSVGGNWFTGNRYRVTGDPVRAPDRWAQVVVDSHMPGKRVTVFYDPTHPARSALLLELAPWYLEWAIWWTVFTPVIACCWAWDSNRSRRRG